MVIPISLNIKYTKYITGLYNYFLSLNSSTVYAILVVRTFIVHLSCRKGGIAVLPDAIFISLPFKVNTRSITICDSIPEPPPDCVRQYMCMGLLPESIIPSCWLTVVFKHAVIMYVKTTRIAYTALLFSEKK